MITTGSPLPKTGMNEPANVWLSSKRLGKSQMPRKPTMKKSTYRMSRTTHSTPKVVRKVTEHHHTPILSQSGHIWIMHSNNATKSMPAHSRYSLVFDLQV